MVFNCHCVIYIYIFSYLKIIIYIYIYLLFFNLFFINHVSEIIIQLLNIYAPKYKTTEKFLPIFHHPKTIKNVLIFLLMM
jgi:hypothetical protein